MRNVKLVLPALCSDSFQFVRNVSGIVANYQYISSNTMCKRVQQKIQIVVSRSAQCYSDRLAEQFEASAGHPLRGSVRFWNLRGACMQVVPSR